MKIECLGIAILGFFLVSFMAQAFPEINQVESIAERKNLEKEDVHNLLQFWSHLSEQEKIDLIKQIENVDASLLVQQKQLLHNSEVKSDSLSHFEPLEDFDYEGHLNDQQEGFKRIQEGQMGCLVLAGGQGSRLGSPLAKGLFPISVIKKKSLLQLCAEKVAAAGKWANRKLPLAIMGSPLNIEEIRHFFTQNDFFGLDECQVFFYAQGQLPLLNSNGNVFLETTNQIAQGPNGNGLSLKEFVAAGIWQKWKEQGIRYVNMIPIDNPLANPFDAELLGFHCRKGVDVSSKSVEKTYPEEKVGVFVKQGQSYRVVEYTELGEEKKKARDKQGKLKYKCANLSLFCFSMDFIEKAAKQNCLPLHLAWKAVPFVDAFGVIQTPLKPNAWKFETFIFDVLEYTDKVAALLCPREECFAPLKNRIGVDSPETVQLALQNRDKQIYQQLSGLQAPMEPFELAADFYYPTSELRSAWKGKKIKGDYIEP